uniref:Uncharacterized protein n=1 Tax=Knipowitschia caucasica TaxID=637954 RepID=A0AAV2JN58_KNICA
MNTRLREKEALVSNPKPQRKASKGFKNDETKVGQKQLTLTEAMANDATQTPLKPTEEASTENVVLAELRKLRQENASSFREFKDTSNRLETKLEELNQKTESLEERVMETENRAWKQRDIQYTDNKVYFDQDYSSDVQRKRKRVRDVIKKLQECNIKAQSPYPAQLRIFLASGTKVFPSLLVARSTLEELGVTVDIDDREALEMELAQNSWTSQPGGKRRGQHQLKDKR